MQDWKRWTQTAENDERSERAILRCKDSGGGQTFQERHWSPFSRRNTKRCECVFYSPDAVLLTSVLVLLETSICRRSFEGKSCKVGKSTLIKCKFGLFSSRKGEEKGGDVEREYLINWCFLLILELRGNELQKRYIRKYFMCLVCLVLRIGGNEHTRKLSSYILFNQKLLKIQRTS